MNVPEIFILTLLCSSLQEAQMMGMDTQNGVNGVNGDASGKERQKSIR